MKNIINYITEKILISKDTVVDSNVNTYIESFGKGEYIQFDMYDYLYDILSFTKNELLGIEKHFVRDKQVYYIKDKDLPRDGKLVNMIRKQQKCYVYGCHENKVKIMDFPNIKILVQIYDDSSGNTNINDVYIYNT